MYELLQYVPAAIFLLVIALAILAIIGILARSRYKTDPGAPAKFRLLMVFSGITIMVAAVLLTANVIAPHYIIETTGGISTNSGPRDQSLPQYNRNSDEQTTAKQAASKPLRIAITETDTEQAPRPEQAADKTTWSGHGPLASALRTERVIVHTANTSILVTNIPDTLAHIERTARDLGGWLVASRHDSHHSGTAAIRVPAPSLRQAIETIISAATQINSMEFTSEDVTEEFIDVQSRLKVLETTEENYINLLAKAENLETNLKIRELLLQIRQDIEQLKGRLNYLSDIAAFSLINITVNLAPTSMDVDAGDELTVQTGKSADFNALITPPTGDSDIFYTWDFGDGTPDVSGNRTALVFGTKGRRLTNPASHTYAQEGKHIVHVVATATGKEGVAEGTDTLFVTVKDIPSIRLSLPTKHFTVEAGKELKIRAHFTRPTEIWDYEYIWDFGDGSPSTPVQLSQGIIRLEGIHTYHEPQQQYIEATLTISGISDAGKISATETFIVIVTERNSLIAGSWDIGAWAKSSIRAVFATLSAVTMIFVWLLIFSPLIAIIVVPIIVARRRGWIGNKGGQQQAQQAQ